MADISQYLNDIMEAVYGEEVRGSIHDAIEIINDVGEKVLTTGTAVTAADSSSAGFFNDSLYLNIGTMELWRCTGLNSWESQGVLRGEPGEDGADGVGIQDIELTDTTGLVDTYTIYYTDGNTTTFTVTNGADGTDGENGNKWYRGTAISGKAVNPTVYSDSGITNANPNDFYLNPTEGAIYHCVAGGSASVATWSYDFTMDGGGGGGGTSDYNDLTNKPSINNVTLSGNKSLSDIGAVASSSLATVATSGDYDDLTNKPTIPAAQVNSDWNSSSGVSQILNKPTIPSTLAALNDVTISSAVDGNILEYDAGNSVWRNAENIRSFARYGGSCTFSQLTSSLLIAANEDKFFLCTDGGTIASASASNWILPSGSVIPPDSHIAVVNTGTSANPVYKFDDFGGYVDISGKADTTDLDGWTDTKYCDSNYKVVFDNLNNSYGYNLYAGDVLANITALTKGTGTTSGTIKLTYTVSGTGIVVGSSGTPFKLRILK